ncbi:MAG: beta-ketoacyl-[acyl-carrier-protein] synthase family protein [bacterium]
MTDVVVSGIGLISPMDQGKGKDCFWDGLCAGRNVIHPITFFSTDQYPARVGGEIELYSSNGKRDRSFRLACFALDNSIRDADLDLECIDPLRIGLAVGTILGQIQTGQQYMVSSSGKLLKRRMSFYPHHALTGYLARRYGFRGPNMTISTACASGSDAIGLASLEILTGRADIMLAGGVDVMNEFSFAGFNSLHALTDDVVRPFDRDRKGLALSEGAAFLILEREDTARARGKKIYGRVLGYDNHNDGVNMAAPDPEGNGLVKAIEGALRMASISLFDIGYINAHGTGTFYNDSMETNAIKKALGRFAYSVSISSIKSMMGHTLGAAGALEAIACLMAINNRCIPPTINYQTQDAACDLDYTPNRKKHKRILEIAVSLSSGFGGQNTALVFSQ